MQKDVKFKIREGFFFFSNRNYHVQCRSTKNECSCVADIDFLVSKKKKKWLCIHIHILVSNTYAKHFFQFILEKVDDANEISRKSPYIV